MPGNKQWWLLIVALVSATCYARTAEVADRTEGSDRSAALRRSLLIHDMYHDMSMSLSMSMENDKGKGKKSKKSKKNPSKSGKRKGKGVVNESEKGKGKGTTASESTKGKGKGTTASVSTKGKGKGATSSESTKGKGKGSVSSTKGKGKGKGAAPTSENAPSPSMPIAPVAPVAPSVPSAPSPTVPTARPPTPPTAGDVGIVLAPYDILYTIEQTRIPNQADYRGVTEMTQAYLDGFFAGVLDLSTDIMFSSSSTANTDRTFRLGQPVRVEYNTTIFLSSLSSVVPGEKELNALLMSAFRQQSAEYLEAVQGLSRVNIFSTTTIAEFVESTRTDDIDNDQPSPDGESSSSQPVGMISAAAAGAMILLATGYVAYRRSISDDEPKDKFFDQDGHVTVAGDTYTGDTYTGVDSHSGAESMTHSYLPHNWDANSEYMDETGFHRPGETDAAFEDIPVDVDDYSEGTCDSYDYVKP